MRRIPWLFICLLTAASAFGQVADLVAPGATLEKLAGGFRFVEGPAADATGNVYFTDIPNNRIHVWRVDGGLSTFREDSGAANGLYFTRSGALVACEGGRGRLGRYSPDGEYRVMLSKFEGKPFNSPNDLWIAPDGGIYFTDPRYGRREDLPQGGEHVYYLAPDGKRVTRVADDLVRPNGIIGTPDGKILYITDHGAGKTWAYDIGSEGVLSEKRLFAPEGSDGMTLDASGNLYLTTRGVSVYDSTGKHLGVLVTPERPANVTFGARDGKTLFITARTSLYAIRMRVKGAFPQ